MDDRTDRNFKHLVKCFISLICLYGIATYLQIALPFTLLFGPIQFKLFRLSQNKKTGKSLYFHLVPFVVMFAFYCILPFTKHWNESGETLFSLYRPLLDFLTMLFAGFYGTYVWFSKRDQTMHPAKLHLVLHMGSVGLVLTLFFGVLFLSSIGVVNKNMIGFDSFFVVWGLLIVLIGLMISYLIDEKNALHNPSNNSDDSVLNGYAVQLEKIVNERKLYLNSNLSLDDVSNETGIPKHNLSQVFNLFNGKAFYQYIAEKRIQEAVRRIEDRDNLTFESLAYECGFNSKTSFNKYFKLHTGKTPSEYRSLRHSKVSNSL